MLNNKENTLPTWIFFSNVDATLVNESARQLLVWSGESFGRLLRSTENILNALMSNDHRLTRESVVELVALLGSCVGSNPYPPPDTRSLFTDCIMVLSRYLAQLPKDEI
ncbi:hypothetical protein [Parasutterella sp.]|jgi:hypothetical protein|uniref:hypothetical protein n=1 Tax=Parasutterella sp. TaxID=2049037 RepID=UPI002065DAC0|nr:MAG TPA: hypothetical protein [Caudoviricetes sp.]